MIFLLCLIVSSLSLLLDKDDSGNVCDEFTSCRMVGVDVFHVPLVNFENDEREQHTQRGMTTVAVLAADAGESSFDCVFDSNGSFI